MKLYLHVLVAAAAVVLARGQEGVADVVTSEQVVHEVEVQAVEDGAAPAAPPAPVVQEEQVAVQEEVAAVQELPSANCASELEAVQQQLAAALGRVSELEVAATQATEAVGAKVAELEGVEEVSRMLGKKVLELQEEVGQLQGGSKEADETNRMLGMKLLELNGELSAASSARDSALERYKDVEGQLAAAQAAVHECRQAQEEEEEVEACACAGNGGAGDSIQLVQTIGAICDRVYRLVEGVVVGAYGVVVTPVLEHVYHPHVAPHVDTVTVQGKAALDQGLTVAQDTVQQGWAAVQPHYDEHVSEHVDVVHGVVKEHGGAALSRAADTHDIVHAILIPAITTYGPAYVAPHAENVATAALYSVYALVFGGLALTYVLPLLCRILACFCCCGCGGKKRVSKAGARALKHKQAVKQQQQQGGARANAPPTGAAPSLGGMQPQGALYGNNAYARRHGSSTAANRFKSHAP